METIKAVAVSHFLALPIVASGLTLFCAKIDAVILFALRFFKPETIKAEIDRLDAMAKARVDKDAAKSTPAPKP